MQLSLFDHQDMAEITAPAFPGERLIVCRNPLLADERQRKRKDLLAATETNLEKIAAACRRRRRPLRGAGEIGKRLGVVLAKHKMGKHFRTVIAEDGLSFERDEASIAPPRPPWTASTCGAHRCRRRPWTAPGWSWPTRAWRRWSARSAA